ncbi:MAG: PrsW family glutamic-type intramembrane protease [Casimicrobiaceae bacterium]
MHALFLPAAVALLPVLAFLGALLYFDSYKLVALRFVMLIVAVGALTAGLAYAVNGGLLEMTDVDPALFPRYVGPVTEECLKGLVVVFLIRTRRIGFLVDAAIFGFAVGTGFAVVENVYYLGHAERAVMGTWIVRGFGTALMHGGATAIFAVAGLALVQRAGRVSVAVFLPGLAVAIALHAVFNSLLLWPKSATLAMMVVLPLLLNLVFERSNTALGEWLGPGFDADAEMLDLIRSGRLSDSPIGQYLQSLKGKFAGPVLADLLCYLQLYTELSLRAKGMLLMRENGFVVPVDDETRAKFDEMRYLERSIGKTGVLAIQPMMGMSFKELWQLYVLDR